MSVKPLWRTSGRLQEDLAKSLSMMGPPATGADVMPGRWIAPPWDPGVGVVVLSDLFADRSTSDRATRQAKTKTYTKMRQGDFCGPAGEGVVAAGPPETEGRIGSGLVSVSSMSVNSWRRPSCGPMPGRPSGAPADSTPPPSPF